MNLKFLGNLSININIYKFFFFHSSLRSPNIVNFYGNIFILNKKFYYKIGACIEPRLCLVMEYCSRYK